MYFQSTPNRSTNYHKLQITVLLVVILFVVLSTSLLHPSPKAKQLHSKLFGKKHNLNNENSNRPGLENCTLHWYEQTVDHFGWVMPSGGSTTFKQRYFICDLYWLNPPQGKKGPIFFYSGNEADVTLYVNNTGLMWESAPQFGALLVFAEHRYFGKSVPFNGNVTHNMNYLSSEQALADYAQLIRDLKSRYNAEDCPVITFGGSYGGMLSSWFRMKYPSVVDGAIAASAPIMSFLGEKPAYDITSFAHIVTKDASPYGGGSDACVNNIRNSWNVMYNMAKTQRGLQTLSDSFKLCKPLKTMNDAWDLAFWAQSAFDYMAMGDYPYSSSYITNGDGMLPPFPMRVGCKSIDGVYHLSNDTNGNFNDGDVALMKSLRQTVSVFYNATKEMSCFDINGSVNNDTQQDADGWNYLFCTEMFQPSARNGVTDMFWNQPWSTPQQSASCEQQFNVKPRPYWATINYGGWRIESCSNIVFSNGHFDPWSGGGVTHNITDSLVAIFIEESAHHLDLMWPNPADPQSVIDARNTERMYMKKWIDEVNSRTANRNSKQHQHTEL